MEPNQNNTGISGFGNTTPNPNPSPTPPTPSPVQSATGSIQVQNTPVPTPPQPTPAPTPVAAPISPPNSTPAAPTIPPPPAIPAEVVPNQNFKDKKVIGGVEEPPAKKMFSMPSFGKNKKKEEEKVEEPKPLVQAAPMTPPPPPPPPTPTVPSYNEITAPGKNSKLAMMAIIAGVILLIAAGGAYYYLNFMNKPAPIEPEPVVEAPEVIEDNVIQEDPYILHLLELEASMSADPATVGRYLESIELEETNMELMDEEAPATATPDETLIEEEEPLPVPEVQPETPIP